MIRYLDIKMFLNDDSHCMSNVNIDLYKIFVNFGEKSKFQSQSEHKPAYFYD